MLRMNKNINTIQAIRAIAALMIMIFHSDRIFSSFNWDSYINYVNFGKYGVDIFFILSGFIITFIYKNNLENLWDFGFKRIIRIYPVYLEVLIIGLFMILSGLDFRNMSNNQIDFFGSIFLINPTNHDNLILSVAWTLSYEIWFYLIFGLSMAIFGKKFYNGIVIFFLLTIMNQFIFKLDNFFLGWYNYEFCFGIVLATYFSEFIKNIDKKIYYPKPILLIGSSSYSLYLLHIPLLEFFGRITGKFASKDIFIINLFWIITTLSIVIILSIMNHIYFEKPIIRYFRNLMLNKVKFKKYLLT